MKQLFIPALLTLASLAFANAEEQHLKLYASFDHGAQPEIAVGGAKLRESGDLAAVDGKFGKAFHFSRKNPAGGLLYDLGSSLKGREWTIMLWLRLDQAGNSNYGSKEPGRNIFRTGFAWGDGTIYAGFDNWAKLQLTQFDADKNYRSLAMPSAAFPANEWIHLAFTDRDGERAAYINGNEATYIKNEDVQKQGPTQSILRIGSLDAKNGHLEGAVDELKIFDKALGPDKIREIMQTTPGKTRRQTLLYDPLANEIAPRGEASFNASELVFSKDGVKIVRHGYDRKGSLLFSEVKGLSGPALTVSAFITPDWNGADNGTHGIFYARTDNRKFDLVKQDGMLVFTLETDGRKESVSVSAAPLKKGKSSLISAGFDTEKGLIRVTVDDVANTRPVNFRSAAGSTPGTAGTLGIGDLAGHDAYSAGQLEGAISGLLAVNTFCTPAEVRRQQLSERKQWKEKQAADSLPVLPKRSEEEALWSLDGAEKVTTATRERITLNALWRFQLTDAERPFDVRNWEYLAVPGRYSGQGNGMADAEFFRRDANLKKLPGNADYHGKSPYDYVSGYFERSFHADPTWKDKQVILLIDELSNSQKGTVYLNGRKLAGLPHGAFFEIPVPHGRLKFGEDNFLTIHTVDGGEKWAWRGIKGDVSLLVKPPVCADDPAVTTSVKDQRITFEITLKNGSGKEVALHPEARISGPRSPGAIAGQTVTLAPGEERRIAFGGDWADPLLWSPDTPNLYTVQLQVRNDAGQLVDEPEKVRFGFREFELRGRDYYLNGSRIHLFNHDGWVNNSSAPEEARRVARTLKKLGYNSVRTLFPVEAKDNFPANIMRVCDEEGLLQFVCLDGVTGREFAVWNDPEVRKNLERKMAGLIRRYRNHPSNVMYFLSSNFLGYGWDYHPLKMADGYQPPFLMNRYRICLEGADIMRKYDSSRPFFFQAGGNFGPVITNNAYFCWWPQAERNAWPEEWRNIGEKPLHIIETSFPYHRSFNGMDLKYSQTRPLFYYENLARYYGPEAYLDRDAEMLKLTADSTQGKAAEVLYDAPFHQKLKSDLVSETIPLWRGSGISGICPFAEVYCAFRKNAPPRTSHVARSWEVVPRDFRRFGWNPDLRKFQYQCDINPDEPLPFAEALAGVLAPRLAFFDGGPESPADRRRNYYGGDTLVKGLTLINDTRSDSDFSVAWKLTGPDGKTAASGNVERSLTPGEIRHEKLEVKLPEVAARSVFHLIGSGVKQPLELTVFPRRKPVAGTSVALYDEKGMTAGILNRIAPGVRDARSLDDFDGVALLVIGRESLTPGFSKFARQHRLGEKIDGGGLNVLICEQRPEALEAIGLQTKAVYARNLFAAPSLRIPGLAAGDFSNWGGDGTLAPSKQPPPPETEEQVPSPLWHWSNRNMVSSYPVRRPVEGDCRILLPCGKDLLYTALLEMRSGKGKIVVSQLEISGRTSADPAAELLLAGLLERYAKPIPVPLSGKFLSPAELPASELNAVRSAVEAGAVLLAPPGSFSLFGLSGRKMSLNRFSFTEAGRRYWPDLTARDGFLRAPQEVTVLAGHGLTALTEPAFAAELKLGGGKVIFLETPANPQAAEAERGSREGTDSSVLWSAEILAGRFRQLRNRVIAAYAPSQPSLAKRLERIAAGPRIISLNGKWNLRIGKDGQDLNVNVPGYYNYQHPQHDGFVGTAVYSRSIRLPSDWKGRELLLDIGAVDDLDATFVNGVKIGSTGEETAGYWCARRLYPIPAALTKSGKLDIAVHVENLRGNAGITGYARLIPAGTAERNENYPYTGLQATYDTETHIRW